MSEKSADVVVVGAGAAGLAAAVRLEEAGRRVCLLEGRDRIGGRIHTRRDTPSPVPVELGAEFVHGEAPRTRRLLADAGVRTLPVEGEAWRGRGGRVETGDAAWRAIGTVLGSLVPDRDPDQSFAAFLRAEGDRFSDEEVEAARAFVEGFHAADTERVSERSLAAEGTEGAADSDRVPGGYDIVIRHLASLLPPGTVRIGRVAKRVVWREGHVEVHTTEPDGSGGAVFTASAAVLTVPVGVLRAPGSPAGIVFDPEVPGLSDALACLEPGPVVRVTLAFRRPLWGEAALLPGPEGHAAPPSFVHTPRRPFNAFWTQEPADAPVLVAWSGGARSRDLAGDADALARQALHDLAAETGADPGPLHEALHGAWTHDWRTDAFSLGAYTYLAVGGLGAPDRLARPVARTLFFAGEATSSDALGTVEGALASGERAARDILA